MPDIYTKFLDTIETRRMIAPGDRLLLSLSAGKDSMAMLDMLVRYRDMINFEIGIFHLNHLTRGKESDDDEILVKERAAGYGIRIFSRNYDFNSEAKGGISFEEHARDIRYSMLNDIALSEGFNKIATAHNSLDNTETMLMRIFSGTGIFGLRGINYINGNIIRPILDIHPDDIYSYLKEKKINWREDHTNAETKYLRNYVRNIIIPAINERFPEAEKNIQTLSAHASENEALLSFFADRLNPGWLCETENGHFIYTGMFSGNLPFIKYMLTRTLNSFYGIRLNSLILNEITRRYNTEKSNITLYEKGTIVVSKKNNEGRPGIEITDLTGIITVPDKWEYLLSIEKENSIYIPELRRYLNYRESSYDEYLKSGDNKGHVFIKIPENTDKILLRNRRNGDRIKIENCIKKIKELMIEKKLDISTKKSVPIIEINGEIAAYLPGAVGPYPDRVSCNFWAVECTDRIFVFYFSDFPDYNK